MSSFYKRPIYRDLLDRIKEPRRFIQVLLGPRQVGKTTLALQVAEECGIPFHYASADLATLQDLSWLEQQWEISRRQAGRQRNALLIIDEVQKIPRWSEMVKFLWDYDTRKKIRLKLMMLGSSPWLMQKGLSESLAGRFEMIPINHWTYSEVKNHFGLSLDEYLYFGGYPGAVPLISRNDPSRWMHYINDSMIETTISRDILLMSQINKPVLLRRLFQLGCTCSGQILSFTKMLGQLQDAGNTTTLAHYLELLSGAGLLKGIEKFSIHAARRRSSSPKFCVYNTALLSAQSLKTFKEAKQDRVFWGRLDESAIGAHLLNSIRGTQMELFYWREGDQEIDFVLQYKGSIAAIEVKSNEEKLYHSGMDLFIKKYHPDRVLLVGKQGMGVEQFLQMPVESIFG